VKRLYTLYQRQHGTRKWTRVHETIAYPKDTAVRVFQNRLISSALGATPGISLELRPVPAQKN